MTIRRRSGVIVGIENSCTTEDAVTITEALIERFPEVTFALITGGSSVAFEWDEEVPDVPIPPPGPVPPNSGEVISAGRPKRRRRDDRERPLTGKLSM